MNPAALILAGSRPGVDPLAQAEGVTHKALIEIEGRPMLARVVDAVRAAGCRHVAVSCAPGPVADLARNLGAEIVPAASGPSASVLAGLKQLGTPMLLTTADHALLRPEFVRELIDRAPQDSEVAVMLAERARVSEAMPDSRRTYLRFADGHWSGCNLFLFRGNRASRAVRVWTQVEADRKRPWRIVARLGPGLLLAYALGRLTLVEGLDRLGSRIGVTIALVPASDGLAAVDVDSTRDLADVRRILRADRLAQD